MCGVWRVRWWCFGVVVVWIIGRVVSDCHLPQHPVHGRHQAQGGDCGGADRPPACDGTPGTLAPEEWLLSVRCDPGYQAPDPEVADVPSICTNGVWSIPNLPDCVLSRSFPRPKRHCRLFNKILFGASKENTSKKNLCGVSKEVTEFSPTISNGINAHIGLFPWHAGLYYAEERDGEVFWDQKCGGSLISKWVVLTAAHCVDNVKVEDLRVALGKYYRSWDRYEPTEKKLSVTKISIPAYYVSATYTFDIALLLLSEKIKFGSYIMPVCHNLLEGTKVTQDTKLYVVGWGKTSDGGRYSENLLYSLVTAMPRNQCQRALPSFYTPKEKICGLNTNSESVTQKGDSGGGLTAVNNDGLHYIVGITSTRTNNISLFTNIKWKTHLEWIRHEINQYKIVYGI